MTIVVVRQRHKRFTMEGASGASSINSRATAIKTILLAAWRAKLSNEDWECRIRKVLGRGVNGDVYDLADCLLNQALVGPVPNQLFISYLKHAVNCELVSHGAVLSSIAHQSTNIRPSASSTTPIATNTNNNNNNQQPPSTATPAPQPNRTSSVICLLEFLKTFRDRISCKGTEIECLNLCQSLSQLIFWLLECVQNSLESISGSVTSSSSSMTTTTSHAADPIQSNVTTNANISSNLSSGPINQAQHESTMGIIDLCTETINYFVNRPFTKSLLFISKIEYSKEFDDILKTVQLIQQNIASCQNLQFILERIPNCKILQQFNVIFNSRDMHPSVVAAQQLRCLQTHRIRSTQVASSSNFEKNIHNQSLLINDSTINYNLFNSLYTLIAFEVVLRPARSHKLLARQIAIITNFNSAPINMTYCELIRVCMIGLIDTDGTATKIKWAFFTFLKMPKLLLELSKISQDTSTLGSIVTTGDPLARPTPAIATNTTATTTTNSSNNQVTSFINDLKLAFERLCEYSPLLDEAEYKCNCDFFKCLVKELIKNDPSLIQLKNVDFRKFPTKRVINSINENSVGGHMILKTDPVVTSMLETFDSEQDPVELFGILSQLVSGKQFEFTLSAAASTGRLQTFVKKLVEHNELNMIPRSDFSKSPQIQALIFDITFLILTYIAQQYGAEVIGSEQQTTFNKWFYDSYNPTTRVNCPKEMLKNSDGDVVSSLIKQIVHPDSGGIQVKSINWRSVCQNLPSAMNEILIAWNQGYISDVNMKSIIERIKSKMCFVAVVAATWLQCHIRTLNDADRAKPLLLLNSLTTKANQLAKQQKQQINAESHQPKSESYTERSSLMCSIIRKIYFELVPKTTSSSPSHNQTSNASSTAAIANSSTATTAATNNSSTTSTSINENNDDSTNETSYQSFNDKFISTLTTQEIFLANVKQCLSRGWIDHKSLNSLSSLFKMIGSECFTNLTVEQILTSHESPSDLSRAVNITFGLFHLDIEACAFALLRDTIPSWLMGEKKQVLLNQPRAFALAHLTVMTIIEVFGNLKAAANQFNANNSNRMEEKKLLGLNGIKLEPGNQGQKSSSSSSSIMMDIDGGPKEMKRMKMTHEPNGEEDMVGQNVFDRIEKLNACIADLMRLFKEIMSDSVMSQRTLFPVLFLQQTVVCTRDSSTVITVHLQPEILLDIINLFSSELTFELVLAISNLSTTNSRKFAAKAMCQLAEVKENKSN